MKEINIQKHSDSSLIVAEDAHSLLIAVLQESTKGILLSGQINPLYEGIVYTEVRTTFLS